MTLADTQAIVADYMDRIVKRFKPGVKITVLARTPGFPDRDLGARLARGTSCSVRAVLGQRRRDQTARRLFPHPIFHRLRS